MLNISSQIDSQSMCDIKAVKAFKDDVSPANDNKSEEVPRLILAISNGEKYIATINRINVMLKDLLAEPAILGHRTLARVLFFSTYDLWSNFSIMTNGKNSLI